LANDSLAFYILPPHGICPNTSGISNWSTTCWLLLVIPNKSPTWWPIAKKYGCKLDLAAAD
jgi:hypothetical protein